MGHTRARAHLHYVKDNTNGRDKSKSTLALRTSGRALRFVSLSNCLQSRRRRTLNDEPPPPSPPPAPPPPSLSPPPALSLSRRDLRLLQVRQDEGRNKYNTYRVSVCRNARQREYIGFLFRLYLRLEGRKEGMKCITSECW
jgi:hypothetical protein